MNMDYETQNTISALRTHLYAGYLVIWFNNQNLVLKFRKMCNLGSIAPFFSKAEIKFLGNLFKNLPSPVTMYSVGFLVKMFCAN